MPLEERDRRSGRQFGAELFFVHKNEWSLILGHLVQGGFGVGEPFEVCARRLLR